MNAFFRPDKVCDNKWFRCHDNNDRCIHANLTCDFHSDCDNEMDEMNCSEYFVNGVLSCPHMSFLPEIVQACRHDKIQYVQCA